MYFQVFSSGLSKEKPGLEVSPGRLPTVAVIVPVLNEAVDLDRFLEELLKQGSINELILVDGGSKDGSLELLNQAAAAHRPGPIGIQVISSQAGRALQMNKGVVVATSNVLVFLHADTILPGSSIERVQRRIADGAFWGWFKLKLSGDRPIYRLIECLMNWRSRITGIATGDQVLYVRRDVFQMLGGFPEIPLMEDIVFSRSLRQLQTPIVIGRAVETSSRRWEQRGVYRTIICMWFLRLAHFVGISPQRLATWYQGRKLC